MIIFGISARAKTFIVQKIIFTLGRPGLGRFGRDGALTLSGSLSQLFKIFGKHLIFFNAVQLFDPHFKTVLIFAINGEIRFFISGLKISGREKFDFFRK